MCVVLLSQFMMHRLDKSTPSQHLQTNLQSIHAQKLETEDFGVLREYTSRLLDLYLATEKMCVDLSVVHKSAMKVVLYVVILHLFLTLLAISKPANRVVKTKNA